MNTSVFFAVIGLTLATCFAGSEGTRMTLSHEFTIYANQNLTLSCQPRDSPSHLVYWYKTDRAKQRGKEYLDSGPSYAITKATVDDTAIYVCSGTEWGTWDVVNSIMINVIVPGEPSCAHGWSLYKNACYMHFPSSVGNKTWNEADSYCHGSKARLAQVSNNRHGINFIRDLVKHRNESSFWISQARKVYGNLPRYQSPRRGRRPSQCTKITKMHTTLKYEYCKQTLPFICQRVLPGVPKDVSIEHITSSTAHVGWTAAASSSGSSPRAYHIELTTPSGNVVSRRSSNGLSVLFTHLKPNTRYQVRVQAENAAGNGSSSSFVAFRTKERPPIIVSSVPDAKVIAGNSITLQCGHSHQDISWYIEDSDVPIARGHKLTIHDASAKDEGKYHCAVEQGPKGSREVLVIEPPVITDLKGILLKQQKGEKKRQVLLLCGTANRHPLEYAWTKDGAPLASNADMLKVSLKDNAASGEYECHVTNLAGSASKSLVIDPIWETARSTFIYLISTIACLSALLIISCFVTLAYKRKAKPRYKRRNTIALTTQSNHGNVTELSSVEITVSEHGDTLPVVSRSSVDVRPDYDDVVLPYEIMQIWARSASGPYKSLRRGEDATLDVTQARGPDYLNISPSNRSDSAANCMYAPLKYTQGGSERTIHPYANVNDSGTCIAAV